MRILMSCNIVMGVSGGSFNHRFDLLERFADLGRAEPKGTRVLVADGQGPET